jgi:uncharacterized protein YabE (DUF348 family)/3D (Asp-Asp-Asp) domain-containing protein
VQKVDLSKSGRFKKISMDPRVAHKRLSNPGLHMRRRTGVAERVRVRAREMSVPTGSVSGAAKAMASRLPIVKIAIIFGLLALASFGILIGANAYAQSRQLTVRLDNGIYKTDVQTTARTVHELLEQCHLRIGPNDEVTPALNSRLTSGMSVMISRAMIVYITSKGQMKQQYMTGGTVQDALAAASIDYDQDDEISPSLDAKLMSGIRISHVAVDSEIITETHYLKYSTIYENSKTLLKGQTKVMRYGSQGQQTKEIKVTYKDGVEVSRVEVTNTVSVEPVSRIILKGTGSVPKPTKPANGGSGNTGGTGGSGGTGNTDTSATDGSTNYGGHYSDVKPEDLIVPPAPTQFETQYYMTITAYTHTGRKTAYGGWPQYTRTLKKPGTIAVDHSAIPYGTLLYVTGYGYCVAEDTGSNAVDSSRMGDVFMNTKADCYKWGRRRNVTVYVVQTGFTR